MSLLLDTHILLWYLEGKSQLPPAVRLLISDASSMVFVSAASWWEIAVKVSLNKLMLDTDLLTLQQQADEALFELLPINPSHVLQVSRLPYPASGHRDPFDRLLIAQAQAENLTLISLDSHFHEYDVRLAS